MYTIINNQSSMSLTITVNQTVYDQFYSDFKSTVNDEFHHDIIISHETFYQFMKDHIDDFVFDLYTIHDLFKQVFYNCSIKIIELFVYLFKKYGNNKDISPYEIAILPIFKRRDIPIDIFKWMVDIYSDDDIIDSIMATSYDDKHLELVIYTVDHMNKCNFVLSRCIESMERCILQSNNLIVMYIFSILESDDQTTFYEFHPCSYILWSIIVNCTKLTELIVNKYCTENIIKSILIDSSFYFIRSVYFTSGMLRYIDEKSIWRVDLDSVVYLHELYMNNRIDMNDNCIANLIEVVEKLNGYSDALIYLITVFPLEAIKYIDDMSYYFEELKQVNDELMAEL